jgi:hypothetical protein
MEIHWRIAGRRLSELAADFEVGHSAAKIALNVGADSRAYRQQLLSWQPAAEFGLTFRVIAWMADIHQKQESRRASPS